MLRTPTDPRKKEAIGTPVTHRWFAHARIGFARVVMLYALGIHAFLAWLYVVEPQKHIAMFGVSISGTPESLSFLRAGPGAMFTALAATALRGLVSRRHFIPCMRFIVLVVGCIVAVRLVGMAVDGVTAIQLSELRDEGISWLFFVLALLLHPAASETD